MRTTTTALAVAALGLLALTTPAQAAPGPVTSWELSETSGRTMYDSTANRIHGSVGSHIVMLGGAYAVNGPSTPDDQRLVVVADDPRLDPGTESYAVTVRFRTQGSGPNIVQKGQATVAGGFWKVVLSDGYPRCRFRDGTGRTLTADLVGTGQANIANDYLWHVVRCERTAAGVRVVLDPGTTGEASRFTPGSLGRIDNTRALTLGGKLDCDGRRVGCDYFTGYVDYLRVDRP